jgi:hypothetical protein
MKLSAVLAVTAFLSIVPLRANVLSNPGFESGDFTSWTVNRAPEGVTELIVSPLANSGSFSAGFGATVVGSYDSISQNLATTIGQSYNLGFFVASLFEGTGDFLAGNRTISTAALDPAGDFQAFWNGTLLLDLPLASQTITGFSQFSFTVQGTGSDTLLFRGYNLPSFYRLDDVSVNAAAAPEPATWAVMGIGFAALLAVSRIRFRVVEGHAARQSNVT